MKVQATAVTQSKFRNGFLNSHISDPHRVLLLHLVKIYSENKGFLQLKEKDQTATEKQIIKK
jgi:hypothetical protein